MKRNKIFNMGSRQSGAHNSVRTTLVLGPPPPPPRGYSLIWFVLQVLTNFESRDLGRGRARFRIKKYNQTRETLGTIQ